MSLDVRLSPDYAKAFDTLRALSADMQKKGLRSALRSAARPVALSEAALAPDDPKTGGSRLRSAVNITVAKPGRKVRTGKGNRVIAGDGSEEAYLVGPNKGAGKKSVSYIGWFLEKGTKPHPLVSKKKQRIFKAIGRSAGMHPGAKAQRWTERAYETASGQVNSIFYESLSKWVAKHGR